MTDSTDLYELFKQLPHKVKLRSVNKLLKKKAGVEEYEEVFKFLTTFNELNLGDYDDYEITESEIAAYESSSSFNDDLFEDAEGLGAVAFDLAFLLQGTLYDTPEHQFEGIEVLINEAVDHLLVTVTCRSDEEYVEFKELFLLKRGVIFKTVEMKKDSDKVEVLLKVYGLLSEDICLN
jgi:hypothetical protein